MATTHFDVHQAVEEASSTTLPAGWSKYPTNRALVLTRTITAGIGAVLTVALIVFFIIFAQDVYTSVQAYEIITVILFLGLALWLAYITMQGILTLRDIERRFFLITPDGFAQVKGAKVIGFPLTDLTRVRLVRDLYGVSLLLTRRSGEIVRVSGLREYGQPTEIGRQMIAACSAIYEPTDTTGATPKKAQ